MRNMILFLFLQNRLYTNFKVSATLLPSFISFLAKEGKEKTTAEISKLNCSRKDVCETQFHDKTAPENRKNTTTGQGDVAIPTRQKKKKKKKKPAFEEFGFQNTKYHTSNGLKRIQINVGNSSSKKRNEK